MEKDSLAKAHAAAMALFDGWSDGRFVFHDRRHTLDVHDSVARLAREAGASREECLLLQTAALFHDVGFMFEIEDHEAASARHCREALPALGYTGGEVATIERLILATRLPQQPKDVLEALICDADLDYLGREDYPEISRKLQLEYLLLGQEKCDWLQFQIAFMEETHYHTAVGRALREAGKERNLQALREKLASKTFKAGNGETPAELRTASVLFVDLCDSTPLGQSLAGDPDKLKAFNSIFMQVCEDAIALYRGFALKRLGDGVMASFGAPKAFDADALNAVRAAFRMREAVQRLEPPLAGFVVDCRIGIATGEVYASLDAEAGQSRYEILGPTVNLAARLQGAAGRGEIVLDPATAKRVREKIDLREAPPLLLKGIADDFAAHVAVGEVKNSAGTAAAVKFVGREEELRLLDEAFAETRLEDCMTVLLLGEGGLGKTRLLAQWIESGARRPNAWLFCDSITRETALAPVVAWLRDSLAGFSDGGEADPMVRLRSWTQTLPTARRPDVQDLVYLGHLLGLHDSTLELAGMDSRYTIRELFRVLRKLLASSDAHGGGPALVVIENAQWLDALTAEWLAHLRQNPPFHGVMIILSGRAELELLKTGDSCREIHLGDLSDPDRKALVRALLPGAIAMDDALAQAIETKAGGNPLYMIEMARQLRESIETLLADNPLALELHETRSQLLTVALERPNTLAGILQSRIDRLDPSAKDLLLRLSVFGRTVSARLLSKYAETLGDISTPMATLKAEGFICDSQRADGVEWRFLQGTMCDAAYSLLTGEDRRRLHRETARALAFLNADLSLEAADRLARHYELAGEGLVALPHLQSAAERAREMGGAAQALAIYERMDAILLADETALRQRRRLQIRTKVEMGSAQRLLGRSDVARETLETALGLALAENESDFIDRAQLELAILEMWQGLHDSARERLDPILARQSAPTPGKRSPLRDIARTTRGILAQREGDLRRGLEIFDDLSHTHAHDTDRYGLMQLVDGLNNAGLICWKLNELDRAEDYFQRALAVFERKPAPFRQAAVLNNLTILLEQRGRITPALEGYRNVIELARENGFLQLRSAAENNLSNLMRRIEEPEAAHDHAERAVALTARLGDPAQQAEAWHNLALARAALGRLADAMDAFESARMKARQANHPMEEAWLELDLKLVRAEMPNDDATDHDDRQYLDTLRATIVERQWHDLKPVWQRAWATITADSAEGENARRELAAMTEKLEAGGQPLEALTNLRQLQRLAQTAGDVRGAREYDTRAQRILQQLGISSDAY